MILKAKMQTVGTRQ